MVGYEHICHKGYQVQDDTITDFEPFPAHVASVQDGANSSEVLKLEECKEAVGFQLSRNTYSVLRCYDSD